MSIEKHIKHDDYIIQQTHLGYYEVANKPSEEELNKFYSKQLYQEPNSHSHSYKIQYSPEELTYIENKSKKIYEIVKDIKTKSILDIGCGEGYVSRFFIDLGYNCKALDYSSYGVEKHNPIVSKHFIKGNIFENLNNIISNNEKFGIIILNNVIEHVLDPKDILLKLRSVIENNGVCVITSPNDFSNLQLYLLENKMISKRNWICPPMHLSYFNLQTLSNLVKECKYEILNYYAEYPIDFDLLVDNTNYVNNSEVGKHSHLKRLRVDNFLCSQSISKVNNYNKSLADLGAGRDIVMFLKQ